MISETFIFISCHVWMVKLFFSVVSLLVHFQTVFSWCLQIRSWLWIFLLLLSSPPSLFLSSLPGCRPHDNKRWTFSYGMWNRWSRWEITRNLFCSRRKKLETFVCTFFPPDIAVLSGHCRVGRMCTTRHKIMQNFWQIFMCLPKWNEIMSPRGERNKANNSISLHRPLPERYLSLRIFIGI